MNGTDAVSAEAPRAGKSNAARSWRRAVAPTGVALARLRSRPGRNLLLVAGLAVATGTFVAVLGGTTLARELSLERAIRAVPPAERSFRIDLVGLPAEARPVATAPAVERAFAHLTDREPARVVAFRDFWLDGEMVRIGGVDGLRDAVHVVSGRLPRSCDPTRCEVLQVGSRGKASLDEGDLHFVRVGVGRLRDRAAFGPAFLGLRQERAQRSWVTATVLLGPDARTVERLPALQLISRFKAWVVSLEEGDIRAWDIGGVRQREARAQAVLERADPALVLTAPDAVLVDAKARGDVYGERMALVGGSVAVALFGFALVAAIGLRRGLGAERRRLAQRGATRGQVLTATMTEVGVLAAAGWLAGIALGAVGVGVVASAEGLPIGETIRHSIAVRDAALALAAALLLALLVLTAVVSSDEADGRRSRIRPLDVATLGALLAIVVALSRGALHAGADASTGDRTLLLLLPALVCTAGGLLSARLLGPLTRLAERLARRSSTAFRLALLALARAPARTGAAGAFLVVTVGLVVFAGAYRATLDRGMRDEAAFTVPLDLVVTAGASLFQPLDRAALSAYGEVAPGAQAFPVLRTTVTAAGAGTSVVSPALLGVPTDALRRVHWRSDFSASSRTTLAEALAPGSAMALRAAPLPPGTTNVRLGVSLRGVPLRVDLVVEDDRGRMHRLPFGEVGSGRATLTVPVPTRLDGAEPRRVVALELDLSKVGRAWLLHLGHERRIVRAPSGTVSFGPLDAVDARGLPTRRVSLDRWVARGRDASVAARTDGSIRIAYAFPDVTTLVVRPRQPTDIAPVPVVASPGVASAADENGLLTLDLYDSEMRARLVGVAYRFPTVADGEEFVIGDEQALATALDSGAPGTGTPGEVWVAAPHRELAAVEAVLGRPPFAGLQATSRERLYDEARGEPLARGVSTILAVAALVALLLALVGLWAALLSDLRDERDTLFDLEAQGADPGMLRRHLRVRALALLAFGLAGGLVLGVVLSRLAVGLVQVTAAAADPFPPLVLDVDAGTIAIALAVLLGGSLIAVEVTVRRAFRERWPERASWSAE